MPYKVQYSLVDGQGTSDPEAQKNFLEFLMEMVAKDFEPIGGICRSIDPPTEGFLPIIHYTVLMEKNTVVRMVE